MVKLRLILGGLFFGLMLIYAGVDTYQTFALLSNAGNLGWQATVKEKRLLIAQVDPDGPAAALRVGDEIVALNGQPITAPEQLGELLRRVKPDHFYRLAVRRGHQVQEFTLRIEPLSLSLVTMWNAASLILTICFLASGLAVFLLKPQDKQALLLALMFGMFLGVLPTPFIGLPSWLVRLEQVARLVATFFFPVFFHFFLIFPEASPLVRRFPRLERYLYVPHLLTYFPLALASFIAPDQFNEALEQHLPASWMLVGLIVVYAMVYVGAGLVSLLVNYRQASRLSRRKLRVILAGSLAGFLPPFLLFAAALAFNLPGTNLILFEWLFLAVLFTFTLFPLSFVYAILRHQVIPVRLMIRRSARYVFVAQGSVVVEVVTVFVAMILLMGTLFTYFEIRNRWVLGVISTAAAVGVWNLTSFLHHRVVAPVIDRRFFRRAYNAQQILSELGQVLRVVAEMREETLEFASAKIQEALQNENVTIFLRDEASGDYLCAISARYFEDGRVAVSTRRELGLPRDSFVVTRLSESSQPLAVDFEDPKSWAHALAAADRAGNEALAREGEALRRIHAALLLPIATREQLLGIISLGPRLGDLPFSREDKQLLMAVAWQMAFAIENARLVRQMAHQMAEEERLSRELEFATQVQQRLFPARPPELAALELSGVCYPARGVGGDYYDFILLGRGRIGIAVADVAGKGISAALLMSIVQASLRSQALAIEGRITDLVASMNRLLCQSTDTSNYATFFYAEFDEEQRLLTYVNAGHNPPLLVRAGASVRAREAEPVMVAAGEGRAMTAEFETEPASDAIRRLETGGSVIGLFEDCRYEHETIAVESGDVVIAYTDGVTEALSPEGEEFGEARLRRVLAEWAHLAAGELSEQIVERVREWCRDAPQADDMTLVVMKVK